MKGHCSFGTAMFLYQQKSQLIQKQANCGIFNIETKKWNLGKALKINVYGNYGILQFNICKNNVYDTNNMYVVSNQGHTIKYNVEKNDWIMIYEDLDDKQTMFNNGAMLWMDDTPYILYCASGADKCCGYLDVRDNKSKWITTNDT